MLLSRACCVNFIIPLHLQLPVLDDNEAKQVWRAKPFEVALSSGQKDQNGCQLKIPYSFDGREAYFDCLTDRQTILRIGSYLRRWLAPNVDY